MILNVHDRITLLGILPEQGNFATLKIVRKLREDLSFSEDELKALKLHNEGQQVLWDPSAEPKKDVQIGEKATDMIVESLKKLDRDNKLTPQHLNLYENFIKE